MKLPKKTPKMLAREAAADAAPAVARAEQVLAFHAATVQGARQTVLHALGCGYHICRSRDELQHGAFLTWVRRHITRKMSLPTAYRYAALWQHTADRFGVKFLTVRNLPAAKFATVANLPAPRQPDPEILFRSPADLRRIMGRKMPPEIRGAIESGRLSQLYREFGIVKPPKPPRETEARAEISESTRDAGEWVKRLVALLSLTPTHSRALNDDQLTAILNALHRSAAVLGAPIGGRN